MRYNYNCQVRNGSDCRIFERVRQPKPIPDDLYVKTKFDNDLDWVIVSQENTGEREKRSKCIKGEFFLLAKLLVKSNAVNSTAVGALCKLAEKSSPSSLNSS